MKIRILGNKLRLRLGQQEIRSLADGQPVIESVNFPVGDQLQYTVVPVKEIEEMTAAFLHGKISIEVPSALLTGWEFDDRVGLYHEIEVEDNTFSIAVEKDFKCLHKRPGEDETDSYPNPLEGRKVVE